MNARDWKPECAIGKACPELLACDDPADLIGIFAPEVQIAVLSRPVDPAIEAYFAAAAGAGRLGSGFRSTVSLARGLAGLPLPDLPGHELLLADVRWLVELYGDLLGCKAVGLRLEVIERAMCPRFHVDRVGLRMLCTYRGPGTEWLHEASADRSLLGSRAEGVDDERSGLIRDPGGIQAIAPFSVALLKGCLWQGNQGRGLVHRSPGIAPDHSPRALMAIDAVWD